VSGYTRDGLTKPGWRECEHDIVDGRCRTCQVREAGAYVPPQHRRIGALPIGHMTAAKREALAGMELHRGTLTREQYNTPIRRRAA
jgi:hypothetical protein